MGSADYIEYGGYEGFILQNGRCAITGDPFAESEGMAAVPLPDLANWPFPVHGDYPLGTNAKAIAFVRRSQLNELGIPIGTIREAIECKDGAIIYHPVIYTIATADEPIPSSQD